MAGPPRLRFAARTDKGLVRRGNQDSAYVGSRLLAVADGMGGMAAGDLASAIVIAALAPLDEEPFPGEPFLGEAADGESVAGAAFPGAVLSGAAIEAIRSAVERANLRLRDAVDAEPARRGMGTTLTALLLTGSDLIMVHIGDSRAYLLRNGDLVQITRDDTFVQMLVDDGHITLAEADTHPQRFLVTKALQGSETAAEYAVYPALPGDRYLLCSDGLSGVVDFETLRATLRDVPDLDQCADRLVELALAGGGPDNITAVVTDIVGYPVARQTPVILGAAAG
ncbi:MAG: serine/threonine-protein phosphatase [Dactylosporangium sp.]|nr:protein phosphatase 2C domain-containing protein [Dactylosporangium sp.]NNJ62528.1 serine/threonine-protein phosphatase [Dactylosporangium sp.]